MAISVDWGTSVITVPKADTTLVDAGPPEIRKYDVNTLRLALKDLEDDPAGMPYLKTHTHNTEVTLSGITFARIFNIIAPYTVTFEDGQYTINLFGANHNVLDVTNANQVNITTQNSAGLISVAAPATVPASEVADAVWDEAKAGHVAAGSFGEEMQAHALSTEVSALQDLTASEVNTEVVDVVRTDTASELSAVPGASPSLHEMIQFIYMVLRNEMTQDGSTRTLANDAGTQIGSATDSYVGGTVTRGKVS